MVVVTMDKFSPLLLLLLVLVLVLVLLILLSCLLLLLLLLLFVASVVPIITGRTVSLERRMLPVRRILAKKNPDPTTNTIDNSNISNNIELHLPKKCDRISSSSSLSSSSLSLRCCGCFLPYSSWRCLIKSPIYTISINS